MSAPQILDLPSLTPSLKPKTGLRECFAAAAIFWILAASLQWRSGAFTAELGSHPDEAAHYITGLMIRDYLASHRMVSPLAFAEHYYAHYPKVAIGMWPPLFHVVEALWMLPFGPSKVSVLLLQALIAAALAATLYWVLRRKYPVPAAFAGGAIFVLLPLVQDSTQAVMADGLVALMAFWAMIFLVEFLQSERTRDAVLFGVFATLSMCTKANGVALVLLPIFAIAITRRFYLLRERGLYYAAAIVLVFGAPWQVLSYWLIKRSMGVEHITFTRKLHTLTMYGRLLLESLGWVLAAFFLLGIAVFLFRLWRNQDCDLTLVGALALLLSVWVYHGWIGVFDSRYILSAVPAVILLTFSGFAWFVHSLPLPNLSVARRSLALGTVVAIAFVSHVWAAPHKPDWGFDQAAKFLSTPEFADDDFLVIANPCGEGSFVAEVAMRDRRPDHVILRATKLLSSSTWFGRNFQLLYPGADELRTFLDQAPLSVIVVDTRHPEEPSICWGWEHVTDLQQSVTNALVSDPHWILRESFPNSSNQNSWIKTYTRVGPQPVGDVKLDLRYTLGTDIAHGDLCERGKRRISQDPAPGQNK